MKFLCDNCKAKYQIADEKVAGKTVRMKCRKCGHQIEVRAAVTETSAASAPPQPDPARGPARAGLATSLSAAKPRPSSFPAAPSGPSSLAGAFQRNVNDAPASLPGGPKSATIELSVTDEWYVAINGVPVGPVRISELRRKAAVGAVTEESLCWQEGLEEWRPIKSIPDLAALVREAAQGNRPSLAGSAPDAAPHRPSLPSTPRQPAAARISAPPPRPAPAAPPPPAAPLPAVARSNVVPLRPAASSGIEEVAVGPSGAVAAFASPFAPPATPAPSFAPQPLPAPTIDPFAMPPPAPLPAPAPFRDSVHPAAQPSYYPPPPYDQGAKKAGVPLWFWPILVLALGFGGGVAFLVFRPQPQQAPVVIQMPQATAPAPATPPPEKDKVDFPPPVTPEPAVSVAEVKGKPVARKGVAAAAPAAGGGLDLGSLSTSGGGPAVGPNPAGAPAGGGGLDQASVERVVAGHRAGVKRTCWERGGADQKSGVNVTVTANVAPDGSVASTSSAGDDPVVSKCIESQVKSWRFPAPGTSTTLNIPFKFVRQ